MVTDVIRLLGELKKEQSMSKNIKERIDRIISHLEKDPELGKDKALTEIEELMENNNIEPYIRTQIWNIVSMIESK